MVKILVRTIAVVSVIYLTTVSAFAFGNPMDGRWSDGDRVLEIKGRSVTEYSAETPEDRRRGIVTVERDIVRMKFSDELVSHLFSLKDDSLELIGDDGYHSLMQRFDEAGS
ncbi:MAG: hypothetical protein ACFB6S_03005 [Geminicoccaceae bacterium]